MGDKFSVDPETMLQASARFARDSDQLASALGRLHSTLASLGDVTGGDDQGRHFASGYNPAAASIEQALGNLVKGLASIDRGLQVMAFNYMSGDAASQVRKGG